MLRRLNSFLARVGDGWALRLRERQLTRAITDYQEKLCACLDERARVRADLREIGAGE